VNFIPSLELIRDAAKRGYAVPSFCVWNSESMDTVLRVASDCRAPVMLMNGPAEFALLQPDRMADTARAMAKHYNVPAALHLDHGDSLAGAEQCLAAGYTSLMLDYSCKPFAENVAGLQQLVRLARPRGLTTEGEIGAVGRVDDITGEGCKESSLTDPTELRNYVEQTGLDMVAISFGNAHGNYPTRPKLDMELLARLRTAAGIPLVLHGGSGTPEEDLKQAISLGIAKVNVASELVRAVRDTLLERWHGHQTLWITLTLAEAMKALAPVVEKWCRYTGAAGKA